MHQPDTNFCYVADKSCPLDAVFCLLSSTPAATACPRSARSQPLLPVYPEDRRDWEDYGFDLDVPVYSPPLMMISTFC